MKRALYIGPSHAAGGIPVIVDGIKPVEVEGLEYKICGDAYRSNEHLEFIGKTNIEILDSIHKDFSCKFDQGKADGTDFIICKLAVRDLKKNNRSGTVREILDQIQREVGCKLSDGSLPGKKLGNGGLFAKTALYTDSRFKSDANYPDLPLMATVYGYLNPKGTLFSFEGIEDAFLAKCDLFDIENVRLCKGSEIGHVIDLAITLPGNTIAELAELQNLSKDKLGNIQLAYCDLSIKSILNAAKMLSYSGIILLLDNAAFVFQTNNIVPLIINNAANYKYSQDFVQLAADSFAEGGQLKGYALRVKNNLEQMDSDVTEWTAVPVTGTQQIEVNGKTKDMPLFAFPQNYNTAPSLYLNSGGGSAPCCELCGKEPIGTIYWIQNDKKRLIMGVGSECITHFQAQSGTEMTREAKVQEAKEFDKLLYQICLWLLDVGYRHQEQEPIKELDPPVFYKKKMVKWKAIWQSPTARFVKNYSDRFFLWHFYEMLYPFNFAEQMSYQLSTPVLRYDNEQKKWISTGPPDPETCRLEAEKKLLSWYTRKRTRITDAIKKLSELLLNQRKYIGDGGLWVDTWEKECNGMNEQLIKMCEPLQIF